MLPYCIFLADRDANVPAAGVKGSAVHVLTAGELCIAQSELRQTEFTADQLQQAALEFHTVVHAIFTDRAVIPFRFPTWLTSDELVEHMQRAADQYRKFLREHADHVQMELRITSKSQVPAVSASGTDYLRTRSTHAQSLRSSVDTLKAALAPTVLDWRERSTPDGMRLFAMVARRSVDELRERLGEAEAPSVAYRLSGPWPLTEFLPQSAQGGAQP